MADLPKNLQALFDKANSLYETEQWEQAILVHTEFLDLVVVDASIPSNVKVAAYNNRGIAYNKIRAFDSALADFQDALGLDPNSAEIYNGRGSTYGDKGELDRAIADFDKALELRPDFASVYNNRGNAYQKKGESDHAIADFNKALELQPNMAEAYNNRGVVYRDNNEYDHAIADFGKALEIQPNYSGAYNNRGNVYFSQGEYDRAIADYDQAIKIDPKNTTSTHNRAITLSLKKSTKKQEAILKQHEEQLSKLREEFDAEIEKKISEYDINLLRIEEYAARQNEYKKEAKDTGESITKRFACLQWYTGVVFVLIATGIAYAFWQELSIMPIFPLITAAGLCAGPFIWKIRTLKKEKARLMALSQDAYTKGILANLINVNLDPVIRKELLHKFFDHHTQSGSAKLIIDLENNAKSDGGDANVIIQHLKEHLPDKK